MKLFDELIKYSSECISAETGICQKHKWACMRFLKDVENQNTPEFPFKFNEARSAEFVRWTKLFKHRKGILQGKFIEIAPIQKFVFGNIYGWVHRKTGYRRFNKVYWQIARKNAKSQSAALIGTYETMAFLSKRGETSEVYCAATKSEQARIVYDEAVAMLDGCKDLKDRYKVAYGKIKHIKTNSIMRPLSEEDKKTGDGLNPQCGIIDEYHAHETSEMLDIVESGMGARQEPLLVIITTAGFNLNNPCYRVEYDLVSKILNPHIDFTLDNYFAMICELDKNESAENIFIGDQKIPPGELIDDVDDENAWKKANPIICSYPEGVEFLKKEVKEAQEAPEKLRNLYTKHFNIWVKMAESGYMNMEKWAICKGEYPELRGKTCFCGGDLSAKLDLTSVGFEFFIDDKYYLKSHSFMPEDTFEQKRKTDKVPYELWVKDGWITLTRGAIVDYREVRDYMINHSNENGWTIQEICMDPWGTTQISSDLIDKGFTVVEIVQGIKTLSEPTKNFREMVYQRRVVHDGNPVLTWAISNAIVDEVDRNQNIILNKKKSSQRIDPIAAIINAHVRCMFQPKTSGGRVFFI